MLAVTDTSRPSGGEGSFVGLCDLSDGGLVLEQADTRRLTQKFADLVQKLECEKPDR